MSSVRERLGGLISQLPLFLGLVLLWSLLWGKFSWLNLVTGAVFAAVVSVVFYLPAVQLSGRLNLWRSVWLFVKLIWDIVRASVDVSWLALGPGEWDRDSRPSWVRLDRIRGHRSHLRTARSRQADLGAHVGGGADPGAVFCGGRLLRRRFR